MKHLIKTCIPFVVAVILFSTTAVQAQKWVTYTTSNSQLPDTWVTSIAFDGSGNDWIGTNLGGLSKFDGTTNWTTFNTSSGLNQIYVQSLAWFNNLLWVCTGNDGSLQNFDPATATFTSVAPNSKALSTLEIIPDNKGQIWAATDAGLSVLRTTNQWNNYTMESVTGTGFPSDEIQCATPDGNGNIWTGFTFEFGMDKMNGVTGAGTLINSTSNPGFPDDYVNSIAVDGNGTAWAGTNASGLVKLDGSNVSVYSEQTDPSWISDHLHAVAIDQCGHTWIGTESGAARLDGNTWTQFNVKNSPLTNDTVNSIQIDGAGHVWLCTMEGLTEYKPLPEAVSTNTPANGAIITTDTTTVTWWWDCPGIDRYYFEYADNSSFTNSTTDTALTSFTGIPSKLLSNLKDKTTYYWRVKAENDVDYGPFSSVQSFSVNFPAGVAEQNNGSTNGLRLEQNFPNPAFGLTTIDYSLPQSGEAKVGIYNEAGIEVMQIASGPTEVGSHEISFDASKLPNGSYFCRLSSDNQRVIRPMVIEH